MMNWRLILSYMRSNKTVEALTSLELPAGVEKEDGTVLDFKELLEQEIRRSRRFIHQTRGIRFTVGLICVAAAVALCVFVILLY